MSSPAHTQIQSYIDARRPDLARELTLTELTRDPTSPRLHLFMAQCELRLQNFDAVEPHARMAAASADSPETAAGAWHTLARALRFIPKRAQDAVAASAQAVQLDPNYWGYRAGLAESLAFAGQKQEAIAEAEHAVHLTTEPDTRASALMMLALLQVDWGAKRHGLQTAAAAIALDPSDEVLQQEYLQVQARAGRHMQGLGTALTVLRASPTERFPAKFARLALYFIEHRILLALLAVTFLVPLLSIGFPATLTDPNASGASWDNDVPPIMQVSLRVGGVLGIAGIALVLFLSLRPARDKRVRDALGRFARKSFWSWAIAIGLALMALSYVVAIIAGPAVFAALPLPFALAIVLWWAHGAAGWFLRT